ncbi:unnamed protein product [Protopolystoma xenopodis]|uniref:Uncharacterized protein n=1 Tax=Protopolystoma xenopodis TaxID=117903 RepID=A0A3S5BH86_9PLAT|nr:unnamed protein product [Protopolystoma xenopodis]
MLCKETRHPAKMRLVCELDYQVLYQHNPRQIASRRRNWQLNPLGRVVRAKAGVADLTWSCIPPDGVNTGPFNSPRLGPVSVEPNGEPLTGADLKGRPVQMELSPLHESASRSLSSSRSRTARSSSLDIDHFLGPEPSSEAVGPSTKPLKKTTSPCLEAEATVALSRPGLASPPTARRAASNRDSPVDPQVRGPADESCCSSLVRPTFQRHHRRTGPSLVETFEAGCGAYGPCSMEEREFVYPGEPAFGAAFNEVQIPQPVDRWTGKNLLCCSWPLAGHGLFPLGEGRKEAFPCTRGRRSW